MPCVLLLPLPSKNIQLENLKGPFDIGLYFFVLIVDKYEMYFCKFEAKVDLETCWE